MPSICAQTASAVVSFKIHSGCFDLPEVAKVFGQGFASVHCCYAGQSKVLQLWEMSKSCPLQDRKHSANNSDLCQIRTITVKYYSSLHQGNVV